ncbi:hypothetical protein MTR_3g466020 [Medicago truncatula]|uniref:Uncharacterized protein n=1 Tax=Medicago truncatula TaxID=3880 RepID=A0A072UX93_MEDTR|nr:hypothetical protein MTR_3g466020 [Medicago truncatula]
MTTCSPYHESRRSYEGICCCLKNQLPMFVLDELHKRNVLGDNVKPKIEDEPEDVPRTVTKLNETDISFEKVQGRNYLGIKFKESRLGWKCHI